uniref:Ankyrin repeat protein n=1 Tax=viral metagenome TaxID=1070528 RepID=A0A6C0E6F2_9ZZZZ
MYLLIANNMRFINFLDPKITLYHEQFKNINLGGHNEIDSVHPFEEVKGYIVIALSNRRSNRKIISDGYNLLNLDAIIKFNIKIDNYYISLFYEYNNSINCMKLCEYIINKHDNLLCTIIKYSSKYGHVKILEYCKNTCKELKYSENALDSVSKNGYINVLDWWKNSGLPLKYTYETLDLASIYGHINVLDWWKNSGLELRYSSETLDGASEQCHVNVLDWWKNSGLELKYSQGALDYAGGVNVLEWWKNSGLPLKYSNEAFKNAIEHNDIDIIIWWLSSKLPLKHSDCREAQTVVFEKLYNKLVSS